MYGPVDFAENSRGKTSFHFPRCARNEKRKRAIRERHCLVWPVRNDSRPHPAEASFLFLSSVYRAPRRRPTRAPGPRRRTKILPALTASRFCHRGCNNNRARRGSRRETENREGNARKTERSDRIEGGEQPGDASRHLNALGLDPF